MRESAGLLMGFFFGLNSFSKAFAVETHPNHTVGQPCIALIIDDIGYSPSHARQFLNLGVPITFAILPRLAYSYELALEIHDNGHEILLYQPMEPYNVGFFDPGPPEHSMWEMIPTGSNVMAKMKDFIIKEGKMKFLIAEQNIGDDATKEQAERLIELLRKKGWDVEYGIGKNVATDVSEFGQEEKIQEAFADDFMLCIAQMEDDML